MPAPVELPFFTVEKELPARDMTGPAEHPSISAEEKLPTAKGLKSAINIRKSSKETWKIGRIMYNSYRAELDLNHDGVVAGDASFGVRKDIALKLKPSPSKGKRGRKPSKHKKDDTREEPSRQPQGEYEEEVQLPTMKGPSEPQHKNKKLRWDHKVHLIGEKVLDPLIHCCENCALPILIYGRMIPCKHVFCFDCAKKSEKKCPRCHESVVRVEQAALGTVFVCTHGGAKHGVSGCRRTYLSSRDLQAHIQYRHLREQSAQPQLTQQPQQTAAVQLHQRQDYPGTVPVSSTLIGMTTIPPPQLGQSQQQQQVVVAGTRPPAMYQDSVQLGQSQQQQMLPQVPPPTLSLPQTFTSPPPPVGQTGVANTALRPPPPNQQQVVMQQPQQQNFSQRPPPQSGIESYHTMAGRPTGNLITIPIQEERGGYSANPQALSLSQPPPNYPPPINVPPRGFPQVSYATGNTGPPPPRPGHLPPRQGGPPPPPVSTHGPGGMPPRFPSGQTPPYTGQPQSAPGVPWQGPNGPPPRGPPPPCGPGVGPPRY